MRDVKTIEDANQIIRELQDQLRTLTANVIDFKGRRIANAANAVNVQDYVTKADLNDAQASILNEITKVNTQLGFLEKRVKALEP